MEIEGNRKKKKVKPTIPNRKIPKNSYTGEKDDTVGPFGYTPVVDYVKSKSSSAIFSKLNATREIFPIKEINPGPSDYIKVNNVLQSKIDHSSNIL